MNISRHDAAWCAGLFEGEGGYGPNKKTRDLINAVESTVEEWSG